jgi:ribosome-associated protein
MPSTRAPRATAPVADPRPSKTRLKQEAHELQALGEALAELSAERLEALDLDESLLDALRAWSRTRTHEGRRRQRQYIGKLMRGVDVEPLRAAVAAARLGPARDALALHEAERWRDELIAHDDALTRWLDAHPRADAQRLRSLVRNARLEVHDPAASPDARRGRGYRELFRFIRDQEDSA